MHIHWQGWAAANASKNLNHNTPGLESVEPGTVKSSGWGIQGVYYFRFKKGFKIGFNSVRCSSATSNMKSALEQSQVVSEYLQQECAEGRVLGPFTGDELMKSEVMVSRFGVIPKSSAGKWRLIVDLSFPEGGSVNDGIDPEVCSLQYSRVEDAAEE